MDRAIDTDICQRLPLPAPGWSSLFGCRWLAGCIYALSYRKQALQKTHPLILIALVSLPIEVILITVSGRSILHYYLTPLPIMAILTGVVVYAIPRLLT